MAGYRLTHAAQTDIVSTLAWSQEQFGDEARTRYEALIVTAIRDAAEHSDEIGRTARPELGDGVFSWHLAQSRTRSPGGSRASESGLARPHLEMAQSHGVSCLTTCS